MSKQDRQGVRTPIDLDRRYDLGSMKKSYNAVVEMSTEARGMIGEVAAQLRSEFNTAIDEIVQETADNLENALKDYVKTSDYDSFKATVQTIFQGFEMSLQDCIRTLDRNFLFSEEGASFAIGFVPLMLPEGQDFDNLKSPNKYFGGSPKTFNYLNCPVESGTFFVDVEICGDDGQLMQRLTTCSKTGSKVYIRFYYSSSWGEWFVAFDNARKGIAADSGWIPLTIDSAFIVRNNDASLKPVCKITGSVVTVCGVVSNVAEMTSTSSGVVFASGIPEAYRPIMDQHFVCQGSGMNRWQCSVKTDGTLMVSRYGITEQGTMGANTWLPFSCTYQI